MNALQIVGPSRLVLNQYGKAVFVPQGRYAVCGMKRLGEEAPRMNTSEFFRRYEDAEKFIEEVERGE